MATSRLNPVFSSLSGRMGNIVHYKRMGVQCLRIYVIPFNPDTEAQRKNRHTFKEAVKSWKELSQDEKYHYNNKVLKLRKQMSGYNLYISEYMKNIINKISSDTVYTRERYIPESIPLRSSCYSSPFIIKDRELIPFIPPVFVPV